MNLKAVIFDMDGTLGDTLPFIYIALRETFTRFTGRVYSDAEITGMFGPNEEGLIRRRVTPEQYEPALGWFLERYAALHAEQPFPGIPALLSDLKSRGLKVGIATGKGVGSAAISLRAFRLNGCIDRVETGAESGGIKPEQIRRVLAAWNLSPAHAAYVGDTRTDMADAREAGVLPLGAAWSRSATVTAADTPYLFTSVADLSAWLAGQN